MLSAGERQLVCLARAFLSQTQVCCHFCILHFLLYLTQAVIHCFTLFDFSLLLSAIEVFGLYGTIIILVYNVYNNKRGSAFSFHNTMVRE